MGNKPVWFVLLILMATSAATLRSGGLNETRSSVQYTSESSAILDLYSRRFEVRSLGKAREVVRKRVTILNSSGLEYAKEIVYYDKFKTIKSFKGRLLNLVGGIIQDGLRREDIQDVNINPSGSFFDDSRMRIAYLAADGYPFTVEFEYEIEYSGLLSWPTWFVMLPDIPISENTFEVTLPSTMEFRYKSMNTDLEPVVEDNGRERSYRWEIRNAPAWISEDWSPTWTSLAPSVLTAPTRFELAGYEGMMDTWTAFGQWYGRLGSSRQTLSSAKIAFLRDLVSSASNRVEAAEILYRHLQETTRYVSIQLGIGGWQPIDARTVEQSLYGDCKALTNYLQAMLEAVGIPSFPALIHAGEMAPGVVEDFPMNQFNHVVLAVPEEGDGTDSDLIWLECTSQSNAFGHLGAFSEDRHALLITPAGGVLVRTPKSRAVDNVRLFSARIRVNAQGDGSVQAHSSFTGNAQDRVRGQLFTASQSEREAWLRRSVDLPNFELVASDLRDIDDRSLTLHVAFEAEVRRLANRSGPRLFIKLNVLDRYDNIPESAESRSQPLQVSYPRTDSVSISYTLPAGFSLEASFEPIELSNPDASYRASVEVLDNQIVYSRSLQFHKTKIEASAFEEFRQFLLDVQKADNAQVVLKRN